MALYDAIFENAEPLIFDGLGETLTYHPKDGDPRSIVCLVRRTGIAPEEQSRQDRIITVDICALNDATTGIERGSEQFGDRLRFASDPADEFYSFKGESGDECPSSGWLTFTKRVNERSGGTVIR